MPAGNHRSFGRVTATGQVCATPGRLVGFYVNSTTSGTIVLYDNTSAAAPQITGTITPAIGWHGLTGDFMTALWAVIGGTIDVTFCIES